MKRSENDFRQPVGRIDDGAHQLLGTRCSYRVPEIRLPAARGHPCRAKDVCAKRGTSLRRNAHSTEAVVSYRWHPWHGKTTQVVRSKAKRSETVLQVTVELDGRMQQLELPEWMADTAACVSMVPADEPVASVDALRSVQELLRVVGSVMVVKGQHLDVKPQGDADEKTPLSPACTVESLSSPVDAAAVAGSSAGSQAAGERTGGSTAERVSPRTPGETKRKGRVR